MYDLHLHFQCHICTHLTSAICNVGAANADFLQIEINKLTYCQNIDLELHYHVGNIIYFYQK